MEPGPEDRLFLRWRETGDGDALAEVYDRTAPSLLRVAMHLVRHPAHAEDLLQTTFLAAIENAARYDPARPVLGWLIGILHNHGRWLLRSEGRMVEAERLRQRSADDPLAAVESAELTSQVDEAIDRVSEVYQPVLRLHLKHHFNAAQIAHVLGRPPGTVRKQVVRGLELLRNLLPLSLTVGALALVTPMRGLAAVREVVLLKGRATASAVGATSGAVGTLIVGVLAMKKTMSATAAVLVLAAGGWWLASLGTTHDPAAGDLPAAEASMASVTQSRPGPDRENAATPEVHGERTALGADDTWTVPGRVHRGLRTPYPHAHVKARLFRGYTAAGEPLMERRLRTDDTGSLLWAMAPPRETVTLTFEPDEPRHVGIATTMLVTAGDPPPDSFTVWMNPIDSMVVGTVVDEQGHPLPGATVRLEMTMRLETTCDAAGDFALAVHSAGYSLPLVASASGFAATRARVTVTAGSETRVEFRLKRGFRVFGKVNDEDGRPVQGAQMMSFGTLGQAPALSDESGAYEIANLEPGRDSYMVFARCKGYTDALTHLVVQVGEKQKEQDFTLKRGVRVEGIVLGPTGAPVRGAKIYLGFSPNNWDKLDAVSGDDGRFVFAAVAPGDHIMVTQRRGLAPDRRILKVPQGAPVLFAVEVRLGEEHSVAGVVQDDEGKPASGVWISPKMQGDYLAHRAATDEHGRFRIVGLPAGIIELEIFGADYVRQNKTGIAVDRSDLVIRLERIARIAGTIVDGTTGAPLQGFRMRFVRPKLQPDEKEGWGYGSPWLREGKPFRNVIGTWDSSGEQLTPGHVYGVEASAPGYAAEVADHVVARRDARPEELVIRLYRGSTLTGRVVEAASGGAIAGATLNLFTAKHPLVRGADDSDRRLVARTDHGGVFRLEQVPAGEVSLLVEHPAWQARVHGPISIERGADVQGIVIQLDHGARLEGVVLDYDRKPVANAHVRLTAQEVPAAPGEQRETDADAHGRFSFDALTSGVYVLAHNPKVGGTSIIAHARHLRIESGVAKVELAPDLGTSSVRGTVVSAGDLPPDLTVGVSRMDEVEIPWEQRFPPWSAFVRDGRFELRGIPAGSYRATIFRMDVQTMAPRFADASFTVGEGQAADVRIELSKSATR